MKTRGIDSTGDWLFGKGINDYKRNNNAVAQMIQTRLKSFIGDCFFALNDGIDWWNLLGSKNEVALTLAIGAIILKTEGVVSLNNLMTRIDSFRQFTLSYDVTTIYSSTLNVDNILATNVYILTEDGDILVTENGQQIIAG